MGHRAIRQPAGCCHRACLPLTLLDIDPALAPAAYTTRCSSPPRPAFSTWHGSVVPEDAGALVEMLCGDL
ncbi:MAG: hypothetical protein H6668_06905 [Ardenticatenaceae bacterium]|nr:hypothetical protein [Ardenticatenaceae bacterium]